MRLSDFILLSEEDKKITVLHKGVLIAKRKNYGRRVFLFQLDSYYVETFCNIESRAIEEFRVFGNTKQLNPYLHSIVIDELLN